MPRPSSSASPSRSSSAQVAALSHTKHAIGCANGTDAILLAMRALDIGAATRSSRRRSPSSPPPARSTTSARRRCSSDIDPDTFNIRPDAAAAARTAEDEGRDPGGSVRPDGADRAGARGDAGTAGDRGCGAVHRRAPDGRRRMAHGRRDARRSAPSASSRRRTSAATATAG